MHRNAKIVGAGVAVVLAAGLGYALFSGGEDELGFDTVEREGPFSVRDYPRLTVAEAVADGPRQSALTRGFMALADYIAGAGRKGARLPMIAPVLADGDEDGRGWRTRFVMPADARVETLPVPSEGIRVRAIAARRVAAVRFSGEADDLALAGHEAELRRWMKAHGHRPAGPVEHAFYNAPIVPGPLRRNEVLIPLAA
jgi:hypothetical protein